MNALVRKAVDELQDACAVYRTCPGEQNLEALEWRCMAVHGGAGAKPKPVAPRVPGADPRDGSCGWVVGADWMSTPRGDDAWR